jgi:uncharacterized membrane protein
LTLISSVHKLYKKVLGGVAFIPLTITIVFVGVALLITYYEEVATAVLMELPDYFKTKKPETARTILASILTGIISLTVFSFSMMMVVVNQASSNYSPKVVETLMNQSSNKTILGVYLGTIGFTIITLMHVDTEQLPGNIPQISLLTNIILSIACILLFVTFINKISSSVRITNIIEGIADQTKKALKETVKPSQEHVLETENWVAFTSHFSGYLQVIRMKSMIGILAKYDLQIKILEFPGVYHDKNTPLFLLNKKKEERVVDEIRECFITYSGESIEDNGFYGLRQLREIAVKSLSPGINDPGVASLCIDHLAELLIYCADNRDQNIVTDRMGIPRVILTQRKFVDILDEIIIPIYTYGNRDFTVLNNLLVLFYRLSLAINEDQLYVLEVYIESVMKEADQNLKDKRARCYLNKTLNKLSATGKLKVQSHLLL